MKILPFIILLLYSCTESIETNKDFSRSTNFISLDIDLTQEKTDNISSIIDTVFYKNLFSGEDEMLMLPNKILFADNQYYLFDEENDILNVFNSKGHKIFTINSKGNGPGEYSDLTDFSIDCENLKIYLFESKYGKIYQFNQLGEFEKVLQLDDGYVHMAYAGDEQFVAYNEFIGGDKNGAFNIEFFNKNGKLVNKYFPFDPGYLSIGASGSPFYQNCSRNSYFIEFLNNKVYSYSIEGFEIAYEINFNEEINYDILQEKIMKINDPYRLLNEQDQLFYDYSNFYDMENYISFVVINKNTPYLIIYDKKENVEYTYKDSLPFELSLYLTGTLSAGFLGSHKNSLFSILSSEEIIRTVKSLEGQKLQDSYSQQLDRLLPLAKENKYGYILAEIRLK